MARPRAEQPTPAELEILKTLWERNAPATVRDILEVVNQQSESPRAYTSVMSLMNVMTEKGLLRRSPQGRAFLYEPVLPREQTLRSLLSETLERAYSGSASLLVAHLLDQSTPSADELDQIRSLLDGYEDRRASETKEGGDPCKRSRPKRSRG
ncbi:Predicted transcriptional regulator [Singulisphaera sp. GP187]|uniref:BlaI/MecI/CopY family transcriptional regulator n=1 Tax=Singulisphaera sp. GP187 TaxID=1882752 RepID=UPI00092A3EE8|nr:BlaI/MecI/CopY family transcriptional regulator [Singulisphaera sp. GP187]SIO61980.1 Predicted transcriptional regulator [Singulisphaera sp. GP187]